MIQGLLSKVKSNWLILLIILVAVFFRFYKLDALPAGLHPDEAANGLDIISMFDEGKFAAVYDTNGPREALFFYLQAIFVFIGKVTHWAFLDFTPLSLRIAPAIIGVATVYGVYLLGKELFNRNVGLFASAALAVSAWHVQFSRNGFRAIMAPLALIFLFYFFSKALKTKETKHFVAFGITLALGFYTYLSFRLVPLALVLILGYLAVSNLDFLKENIKKILLSFLVFFVFMIPLFIHFIHVPADILGRSSTSIFNSDENGGSPGKTFLENIKDTALMFNFEGDRNFRHNLGGTSMLDPFTGILLWLGVIISLLGIRKIKNFILFVWFAVMSLPEVLTSEGIPHALRLVGVMPPLFIWIGIGFDWLLKQLKIKYVATLGVFIILVVAGTFGFKKYFIEFPKYKDSRSAYAYDMVAIANDIKNSLTGSRNILITGGYGTKTIEFVAYYKLNTIERYEIRDIQSLKLPEKEYKIYIDKGWIDDARNELLKIGFTGQLEPVYSELNGEIVYYKYSSLSATPAQTETRE